MLNIDGEKWVESASQVGLAFFGGLIGALMRKEASNWQTAMLGAIGAGFVGLLVAKLCHATGMSDDLTFVFVGVSGWLGAARTIDYLEKLIEGRLGVRFPSMTKDSKLSDVTESNAQKTAESASLKDTADGN